jgi:hypothetical protein
MFYFFYLNQLIDQHDPFEYRGLHNLVQAVVSEDIIPLKRDFDSVVVGILNRMLDKV